MGEIELEDTSEIIGLSSTEALRHLQHTVKDELKIYSNNSKLQIFYDIINTFYFGKRIPVDWFGICLVFAEAAILFAGYHLGDENTGFTPLIEGLIVLLCAILVAFLCLREHQLERTEMKRSFLNVVNNNLVENLLEDTYLNTNSPPSPSITTVSTYRDNKLIDLPWNLLVEGDIVLLGPSETAPTQIKQVIHGNTSKSVPLCLDAGEVFNPPHATTKAFVDDRQQAANCSPYPPQKFQVTETPIRRCIRSTFQHCHQRPQSVVNHNLRKVTVIIRKKLFWFFLIASLFVNFVRYRLEPSTVGHYSEVLLLGTAYIILPITPIFFPILWICVSLYGVACIRASFMQSDKNETRDSNVWKFENADNKMIFQDFYNLLCHGDPSALPRTANLLHTLGNVTIFCCVDKSGVLSYPNLTPAKVLMFKNVSSEHQPEQMRKIDRLVSEVTDAEEIKKSIDIPDVEVSFAVNQDLYDTEVLNLSYDIKSANGIQFDDEDWKNYLQSLKPLGLNLMLNSPCPFPKKRLVQENFTGHISLAANCSPVPNIRRCSCPLVREIGFNDHACDAFSRYGEIFTFRPVHSSELSVVPPDYFLSIVKDKLVPSMTSVIVKDNNSGMFQLLTQGSADIVLDACTDFWDGDDLCELSENDRKRALDFYHRMSTTGHCIAFSYRPLIERVYAKFDEDVFIECPNTVSFPDLETDTGSSWSLPKKIYDPVKSPGSPNSELACIFEEAFEKSVVNVKNPKDVIKMLGKQIFMGMITYSDLVKEDTACLVENLNNGGIRFVYFSSENELKSKVFAERLGLETGWNCHISLANTNSMYDRGSPGVSDTLPSDNEALLPSSKSNIAEVDTDYTQCNTAYCSGSGDLEKDQLLATSSNFYLIPNRAKLPRGIRNIRPHLKEVDDVPLLVPLFTDCTPQAVTEMIEIMQEYGETVCCFGSSINIWNSHIFSQADVSIAIDPLHPQLCVKGKPCNYRSGSPVSSNPQNYFYSSGQSSHDISSLHFSSLLNSVPCSLLCHQDQQIDFLSLICEARRLMLNMRSCFLFMLSAYLSLSFSILVSFCFLLPFQFTGLGLLWLKLIIIPLISLSLLGTPADDDLMHRMTSKRISNIYDEAKQYLIHFFPTFGLNCAYTTIGLFAWMLFSFCAESHGVKGDCHFLYGSKNLTDPWHGWITANREGLYMGQSINLFFTTIYFVFLSSGFVHRTKHIWQKLPFNNRTWCKAVFSCLFLQSLYTAISLFLSNVPGVKYDFRVEYIKYPLIMSFLWPLVLILMTEVMKRRYIKIFVRHQKRERLKFDTKLGMNSPV